ncbi:15625_t:CDS:2 [Gigaspora rosea]|nr:15625_t:CDS:2 [Gigaspora rosea]
MSHPNLVKECHKKVALWFLTNFDDIIIYGSAMSHRLTRKINSKTVRKMLTCRFRERFIFKAEELGSSRMKLTQAKPAVVVDLSNTTWVEARCSVYIINYS